MKKFLALMLVFTLLFSGITAFSQENESAINEKYLEACGILSALGIMEVTAENAQTELTRGEFASVVCRMFPVIAGGSLEPGEKLLFRDVTEASEYYDDIVSVFAANIMIGKTNRYFGVEDNVTLDEAVKVLITLLGYEPMSDIKGGVFIGYNAMAREVDMLDGISVGGNTPLNHEVVAQLILNTVNTDFMKVSMVGNDSVSYAQEAGTNILNTVYNVYKTQGQITAFEETDIFGNADSAEGQIEVDRSVFDLSENVNVEYSDLGTLGTFYIQKTKNDTRGKIIYYAENTNKFRKLVYDEENYSEYSKIRISNSANVVYNGAYLGIYRTVASEKLRPSFGNVTLIDSNNNGEYDVLIVRDLQYRIVNNTNYTLGQAILGLGGTIKGRGSISSDDKNLVIYKDGKRVNMEYVGKGDLLEIEENPVNSKVRITVVTDSESAIVTGYTNNKISLDETEYKKYKNIKLYDTQGNAISELEINLDGTFYRDSSGKVCLGVIDKAGSWKYGFLYQAAIENNVFDDNGIMCRILTTANSWIIVKTNSKTVVDGVVPTDNEAVVNNWKNGTEYVGKLCKYKLKGDDVLSVIDVASNTKVSDNEENSLYKASVLQNYRVDHTWGYNFATSGGNPYKIMDTTALISLPNDLKDENYIKFVKNTDIVSNQYYDIQFYSPDEMYVCAAATLCSPGGEVVSEESLSSAGFIVDSLSNRLDEDGNPTIEVNGFEIASSQIYEKSYLINYDALSDGTLYANISDYTNKTLEKGVFFRFMINGKNEITKVRIYFSCINMPKSYYMSNSGYANERVFGELTNKDIARNLYMLKCTDDPANFSSTTSYAYKSYRPRAVAVYDSSSDEIRIATIGDADTGNKVFAWGNYGHPQLTFIVK